jgi:hypothetical protein
MSTTSKIALVVGIVSALALMIISANTGDGTPMILECGVNTDC